MADIMLRDENVLDYIKRINPGIDNGNLLEELMKSNSSASGLIIKWLSQIKSESLV